MRRATVLGILVATAALSMTLAAFQADQTAPVTVEKLKQIVPFFTHSVIKFSPQKELLHLKFHAITKQFALNN